MTPLIILFDLFGRIWKGGADTGFNHVKPREYSAKLLHFHGLKKDITVKEVGSLFYKNSSILFAHINECQMIK